MYRLRSIFPETKNLLAVFSWAVFLSYGWTLVASFWRVPSWLYYLTIGEILSLYAYAFVVAFFESAATFLVALIIGTVFPLRRRKADFVITGGLFSIVLLGSVMARLYQVRTPDEWSVFLYDQWSWWGWTLALFLALVFVFLRFSVLRTVFEYLSERMIAFLYIYAPITAVSFAVVVFRNI